MSANTLAESFDADDSFRPSTLQASSNALWFKAAKLEQSKTEVPEFDDLIEEQGGQGRFQWIAFCIIAPMINLNGFMLYQFSYLWLLPKFQCEELIDGEWVPLHEDTDAYESQCKPEYFCQNTETMRYQYEESPTTLSNWMTQYNLECASGEYIALFSQIYFLGFCLSALIAPPFIERFGRKWMVISRALFLAVINLALIVLPKSPNLVWSQQALMVLVFFMGLSNMVGFIAGYSLFCEYAPKRRQPLLGSLWNMTEGAVIIWVTLYYLHISREWEPLVWAVIAAHFIFAVTMAMTLPESPKWLYKNERFAECFKVLTYMGKINGVSLQPLTRKLLTCQSNNTQEKNETKPGGWSFIRQRPILLQNFFVMLVQWIAISFNYNLIAFQVKYLKGDVYINNISQAASEVSAYFFAVSMFTYFGMRNAFIGSYILSISGMMALLVYPGNEQFWLSVFIIGAKFGCSSSFGLIFISTQYAFPVEASVFVFGICQFIGHVVTIGAPYIAELKPTYLAKWSFITMFAVSLAAIFFVVDEKEVKIDEEDEKGNENDKYLHV